MYKISIIIPVYNAEHSLKRLINSIRKQTFKFEDIQIIAVNDCSTDKSSKILEEYSKKYTNIIVKTLDTNHEVAGYARNQGLKLAQGKYLMFADSDDFLTEIACEKMYSAMEEKNADFIVGNYVNADCDGTLWENPVFDLERYPSFKMSIKDYNNSFYILNSAVWNKIFRRSFIEENKIEFLEGVPAEDAYFTTTSFMKAKDVYYISDIVYCYRQRNKGRGNKRSVSFSCSRDYFLKINKAYKKIYENFKENKHLSFYRYTYAKNMCYILYKFIDTKLLTHDERIEILKEMRWFYELSITLKVKAVQESQRLIIKKILEENYEEAINYCKIVAEIKAYIPKEANEKMSRLDAKMYREISKYNKEFEGK